MDSSTPKPFKYNGARSLIILHEKHLKSFLAAWQEAKRLNISLPVTGDQDYQSPETLLRHVLGAPGRYMNWMCEKLDLAEPGIKPPPEIENIEKEAQGYLEHIIDKWSEPLSDVPEEKFLFQAYKSNWGVEYCIDAMLEHAVMHPIRHEFQLRNLIKSQISLNVDN